MTTKPSVLGLTEEILNYFQQAFKLSYNLNYLQVWQQFVPLRGTEVLEVGGDLPASLVIDHLGCNSWTVVEAPAYDDELGSAYFRDAGCSSANKSGNQQFFNNGISAFLARQESSLSPKIIF